MYRFLYGTPASVELDVLKCQALPPTARFSLRQVIMQQKVDRLCEAERALFLYFLVVRERRIIMHSNLMLWRLVKKDEPT